MNRNRVEWKPLAGTPNYVSTCGNYVATYRQTERSGHASYLVHATSVKLRERKLSNALSVGGLPIWV